MRDDSHFVIHQKLLGEDGHVRQGVVMVKQPGSRQSLDDFFTRFHAFATKCCSRTRNS